MDRLAMAMVAGGAGINGGAAWPSVVLGHVARDTDSPEFGDKTLGVLTLVGADGLLVGTGMISRHCFSLIPLSGARGSRHLKGGDQGMAIFHEYVPPMAR